jgi:hypothetical protein
VTSTLPYIGSGLLAMWTYATGSAIPWAALAGLVALASLYVIRSQYRRPVGWLHHTDEKIASPSKQSLEIPDEVGRELARIWASIDEMLKFIQETAGQSEQIQSLRTELIVVRDLEPRFYELTGHNKDPRKSSSITPKCAGRVNPSSRVQCTRLCTRCGPALLQEGGADRACRRLSGIPASVIEIYSPLS